MRRCPECEGEVKKESWERVCTHCGLVIEDGGEIVANSAFTDFTNVEHHERLTSATGNPLRRMGNRAHVKSHAERRDDDLWHLIEDTSAPYDVKDTARTLVGAYLRKEKKVPAKSMEEFVDAVIYISYRMCKRLPPKKMRERMYEKRTTAKGGKIKTVEGVLNKLREAGINTSGLPLWPRPPELIEELCESMGKPHIVEKAKGIHAGLKPNSSVSKNIACACVYRALKMSGESVTFRKVAEHADANPNTVSKICRHFFNEVEEGDRGESRGSGCPEGVVASGFLTSALYALKFSESHLFRSPSS